MGFLMLLYTSILVCRDYGLKYDVGVWVSWLHGNMLDVISI